MLLQIFLQLNVYRNDGIILQNQAPVLRLINLVLLKEAATHQGQSHNDATGQPQDISVRTSHSRGQIAKSFQAGDKPGIRITLELKCTEVLGGGKGDNKTGTLAWGGIHFDEALMYFDDAFS